MATKIKIRDIKAQWLNAKCLNIIAKYARQASLVDGTKISMSSDKCLVDVTEHVSRSIDPTLTSIYQELKAELRILLKADHLQPKLDALQRYESNAHNETGYNSYSHY